MAAAASRRASQAVLAPDAAICSCVIMVPRSGGTPPAVWRWELELAHAARRIAPRRTRIIGGSPPGLGVPRYVGLPLRAPKQFIIIGREPTRHHGGRMDQISVRCVLRRQRNIIIPGRCSR